MKQQRIPNLMVIFTQGRIRIPKAALRMIGNPAYVRLLINTDERYVAVTPGAEGDSQSNRVPDYIYSNTRSSYLINSLELSRELLVYGGFEPSTRKCALKARACLDQQFVIFSFPENDD